MTENDEVRMTKLEGMTNSTSGYPERGEAESKDSAALTVGIATGFLGFARNGKPVSSPFGRRAFSSFVIVCVGIWRRRLV
jgi:hypothetical protein